MGQDYVRLVLPEPAVSLLVSAVEHNRSRDTYDHHETTGATKSSSCATL
jgi:hypothetical protein